MYINVKRHLLSRAIMLVAIVRILATCCEGALRVLVRRSSDLAPDMMDIILWRMQLGISAVQIIVTALIFFFTWKKLWKIAGVIPKEDWRSMGVLQKEVFGDDLASLSVYSVNRLLQLWTAIFVGAELIYVFTSTMYRRFIGILMDALSVGDGMTDGTFVMLYNMTHGFKYVEILSAILLGVFMTAVFLSDRFLKIVAVMILGLFMLAFSALQMQTVYLLGHEIGIVWTSIIYHATETLGLFLFSLYLSRKYKGL